MTEVNKTTLRQALNKVYMEGYVKKMELESKVSQEGKTSIRGSVTIMTAPGEDHVVNVFVPQLTKENKVNKAYTGMQTLMIEYVSMASQRQGGQDEHHAMA